MKRTLSRIGAMLGAMLMLISAQVLFAVDRASAADPFTGYLMVHFTGEHATGEQIYLAHSRDGLHWNDLNNGAPVLLSTVGTRGVRDPALVRSPNGDKFWIIATDLRMASGPSWDDAANRGSTQLVVWESTDLVNWSAPRLLNVAGAISGAGDAWAPEAIFDPATGDYVVYWATNATLDGVKKHRIYYTRTTDFRTVTAPTLYIDRGAAGHGIIDTQIVESPTSVGGFRYYRASADGQITIEGSNSILGSWTRIGDLSHMGISNDWGADGNVVEGPMWMPFNGGNEWGLWLDQFKSGRGYMPLTSTNLGSTNNFRTVSDYSLGTNLKRHGGIMSLTAAEESRVLAKWGVRPVNRLQSFNYQDRYVRHADFDVRIDPDVSPLQDSQFRIMPGLADSSAVSFESVNYPGYYLRHVNYDFVLASYDGTTQFQADATFRQVAGLASSTWSSFQSYNYPDRYIRHHDYQLKLDPAATAIARNDATFRLTS
ncbi:glycoside hydrolase family 43 protein [Saccharothrix stipae]